MKKTLCDFCGQEIKEPEIKVVIDKLEYDACMKCTNRMVKIAHYQEWGILAEPDKDDRKTEDKPEEKATGDFWATHDPSGGDLPPEDDEKPAGGMKWIPEKTKAPARQQGERKKRADNVDHGKIIALRNAGWPVKEICAEMNLSSATVFNHLKMEKNNEKEQGM